MSSPSKPAIACMRLIPPHITSNTKNRTAHSPPSPAGPPAMPSYWDITATPPLQPAITGDGEWHIVRSDPGRPDLDHQSGNPYDFLPAAKFESMLSFRAGRQVDTEMLSEVERKWLLRPEIRKILVKVAHNGSNPLERNLQTAWLRAAICSAIAQSGGKEMVAQFDRSKVAFELTEPGYGWVIIPIGATIFDALKGAGSSAWCP